MTPQAVGRLVRLIGPILKGHPAPIQGAVLADLLAIWLAGHVIEDDPAQTDRLRNSILKMHMGKVRELIPLCAEAIHGRAAMRWPD
jgi:hypothetical protein